jgi:group I intron endonuclease
MNGIYWIYCLENKINGKKYIGKAVNPKVRLATHISNSKKDSKHTKYIHRAIAKYGIDNFWFRCIGFEFSENEILERERYLINFLDTTNPQNGYNLTLGGEGKSGYKHTVESKKILSDLGSKKVGELNPFYGRIHSDTVKEAIQSARSKITKQVAAEIIDMYCKKLYNIAALSKIYNLSKASISDLIIGRTWKNIFRNQKLIDEAYSYYHNLFIQELKIRTSGSNNPSYGKCILSESQINEIKNSNLSSRKLSKIYGVSTGTILRMKNKETMKQ